MKRTPAYRQPLGQNFVPTELKIDSETGFFIVPAPDEKALLYSYSTRAKGHER